ncbi:MAG: cbb3-type cytochrome oxidase assembly protein CcoS [Lunatimonas sp.]|uniref:cbb3-type cytochrome oxidase assembly protein CcoS n=1 Tax=Lunatimonas sp. TaxID=2060141 RepID=UPI00263BE5A0|nr:cbb3-type cytochrome oxidase assembly protein CcoS [Lunatimonas sp.]MCC5939387.1 cbb3-type cytochrome oxidase assembly protein CcoS [Lunatimonas sp.]
MEVIFVLIGISLIMASGFLFLFIRAMRSGQYDDNYTPSIRMLFDQKVKKEEEKKVPSTKSK